ncbi:hypothetical protein WJX81_003020 [Elliptochloris bilobata]|uniref:Protein kinase domain-containing protein n=1 Tax=Elliptochloris bilobata TaxID=381761 RepID=A0AAW1QZB3_9CHLO
MTLGLRLLQSSPGARTHLPGAAAAGGRLAVSTHMPLLGRRYRYLSLLGEGASAQVVLAEDVLGGASELVAIKVMRRQYAYAGQKEARALRFAPAAARAVQLRGVFCHSGHVCLVLERLVPSLLDYVAESACLAPAARLANLRALALQLLGAVAALHARGVVHADLKPENLLLVAPLGDGSEGACPQVRLADFGSAFSVTATDTASLAFDVQTLPYRAPEVALGRGGRAAMDAWSLGCVLAELALHRPLFPAHSPSQLLLQMEAALGPLPPALRVAPGRAQGSYPGGLGRGLETPAAPQPRSLKGRATGLQASGALASCPDPGMAPDSRRRQLLKGADPEADRAPAMVPGRGLLASWAEALPPLGAELARVDRSAADLILRLLAWDPARRLTPAEALSHPFLSAVSPAGELLAALRGQIAAEQLRALCR